MSIRCPNCTAENKDTARFCKVCGRGLTASAPQWQPTLPMNTPSHPLTGMLPPSARVTDRYLIRQKVGQGGMAAVYDAIDLRTNRRVALKEMSDSAISDPEERQQTLAQFRQEAQLLANLSHPNLPRVTDYFEFNGKQYLAMDFVEGTPLDELLRQNGRPFPEAQVKQWAAELCDVLSYLHAQRPPIIFRDLKPGNIMIDQTGHVKLIDFGIARMFKPGQARDTIFLGTLGYAAPEQTGAAQSDARTDIYALGVTLYELLTGYDPTRTPFQLPPLRQLNAYVSPDLEQVVTRAIETDRNRRWQNVNEIQLTLRSTSSPQPAGPPAPHGAAYPLGPAVINNAPPVRTSRPTARLIMAVARLSNAQIAAASLVVLIVIAAALWFGTPFLMQYPMIWNNVPSIAIVAPLIYAAVRRPWIAPIGQVVIALVGAAVTGARAFPGDPADWRLGITLVAALLTAVLIELATRALPKVRGKNRDEAWQRELVWLSLLAVVVSIVMVGLVWGWGFGLNPIMWVMAAVLGALGWFIGDLIQQWLYLKQTGLKRGRGGN
jgi:serine/threonine protein kinase, bacterial